MLWKWLQLKQHLSLSFGLQTDVWGLLIEHLGQTSEVEQSVTKLKVIIVIKMITMKAPLKHPNWPLSLVYWTFMSYLRGGAKCEHISSNDCYEIDNKQSWT